MDKQKGRRGSWQREGERWKEDQKGMEDRRKGGKAGKDAEESGRGPGKRLAGRRWEVIEGGGNDVDGEKKSCCSPICFLS